MSRAVNSKGQRSSVGQPLFGREGKKRVANALASEVFTVVARPSLVMECALPLAMGCGSCSAAYQGVRRRVGEVDTCRQLGHPDDQEI